MYVPKLYENENQSEIEEFLKENAFAILVNQTDDSLWATHIPLLLEENAKGEKILIGHLSKVNPQAKKLETDSTVLAIFNGPHTYISSSWYDHENVPTWNYIAVHIYGKIRLHTYQESLESLKKLVDKYETKSERPIRIEDLSEKTMREARGIFSFEIIISRIEAQYKLSQNRDEKNYQNIISELEKRNELHDRELAKEMRKKRP